MFSKATAWREQSGRLPAQPTRLPCPVELSIKYARHMVNVTKILKISNKYFFSIYPPDLTSFILTKHMNRLSKGFEKALEGSEEGISGTRERDFGRFSRTKFRLSQRPLFLR